ncbi:apolipoprotein L6-like [Lacerta agilis]|uniref:apolipoprotein L6-like n=1 Tax=Lacerta agilis TaxID=80427 RepID=UPI001419E044|nr:apolipoprotein L6-like [Lacerta agilis]XP_033018474.1 apolipoprotein L6-like [Lacerta agilis]
MSEFQRNAGNIPSEKALDEAIAHFLKEFPVKKEEIEACIQCLRERADDIDKTHKDCTIASITASSVSGVSGILSIVGLALTPVTAGASLILTATGMGLGIASGVTSISAGVSERIIHSMEQKKSQELINECEESLRMVLSLEKIGFNYQLPPDDANLEVAKAAFASGCAVVKGIPRVVDKATDLVAHVEALAIANANPALKALAKKASTVETVARNAIKGIDQVDEAFKGTALAASKSARVAGGVLSGLFLAVDAVCIAKDAIHLSKGAKTEKADELRAKANKLEEMVQNLTKFYMELKEEWD